MMHRCTHKEELGAGLQGANGWMGGWVGAGGAVGVVWCCCWWKRTGRGVLDDSVKRMWFREYRVLYAPPSVLSIVCVFGRVVCSLHLATRHAKVSHHARSTVRFGV